jgi:hypothetical protein
VECLAVNIVHLLLSNMPIKPRPLALYALTAANPQHCHTIRMALLNMIAAYQICFSQ